MTFPLLSLSPFFAHGRSFRTWVLITYQLYYQSFSLWSFTLASILPFSIFKKLLGMTLPVYFDSHCLSADKYSSLSLFSAATLLTSLTLNVAKSFILFSRIKRHPKAWWSAEEAASERCKAFSAAHRSDEDHQAYISASLHAWSVIAKAEAWQATCSSLSPKSVYSLLHSVTGSFLSSSSSNSPNCFSPRESISVFANDLRSHFSLSLSQRPCVAEPEATFPNSTEQHALRSLTCHSFLPSRLLIFLQLPPTSFHPLLLAQTKLPIPY